MDQPVLQRASPVLSGVPPCRTAWSARKQHKTANMVRHWTERCGNSAACLHCHSFATMLSGTYCNALRVLQERWHPAMSWTVLQFVSLANLLFERYTAYDSTGTVAIAKTFWRQKRFLHVAQLCGYYQVSRWLRPYNGWLHLPYETRGVLPPIWFVVGDGMFGSRSLAFFASSLPSLAPPS